MTIASTLKPSGMRPLDDRVLGTRHPYLALILLCTLLWVPGVLSIPASDRDESRFAQGSKQMLQTGDFIRIRNGLEARNRKPVGIYWLQVPFAAVADAAGVATGNPIWPYRLPSLLGGIAAVLAVFGLWRRVVGDKSALLAAAMLAASIILAAESTIATTDAALLAATTIAMGLLGRAYLGPGPLSRAEAAGFWVAIGAGILIKGPITPMVAGLAALSLAVTDRRGRGSGWLRGLRPGWGGPLALLLAGPWFVAIGIATHGAFFADSVGGDLAGKIEGADNGHGALPGLHLLLLPVLAFPSSILVVRALAGAWRDRSEPLTRFLVAWIIPSWLVFEAVPTKLPHYTLPLYPGLFLLAACWVLNPSRPTGPRWLAPASETALAMAAGVIGLSAAVLPFVVRPGLGPESLLGLPALVAAVLVAVLVLRDARRRDWLRSALIGVLMVPLLTWAILWVELPNLSGLWLASKAAAVLRAHWRDGRPEDAAFGAAGFHEPSLMFLCGTETRLFPTGWDAARFLADNRDAVVAVAERDQRAFDEQAAAVGLLPHEFARVDGYNYSRGRRTELSFFTH